MSVNFYKYIYCSLFFRFFKKKLYCRLFYKKINETSERGAYYNIFHLFITLSYALEHI